MTLNGKSEVTNLQLTSIVDYQIYNPTYIFKATTLSTCLIDTPRVHAVHTIPRGLSIPIDEIHLVYGVVSSGNDKRNRINN